MQMGVESLLYITEDECEENEEAILSKKNFDITEKITFFHARHPTSFYQLLLIRLR